jgi:hypothetical protein
MPLDLPNLDDRTYDDLVAEALALIPAEAPDWTNHNASDPGITLIEMFAYLTEMLIYRLNRVSDNNLRAFLRLINPEWRQTKDTLTEEVHDVVAALRRPDRAVSDSDFEHLALAADARVARARCFAYPDSARVRLVVVPRASAVAGNSKAVAQLLTVVKEYLKPRRLLTTRLEVELPQLFPVGVRLTLVLESDAVEASVLDDAIAALSRFLDAERGGPAGRGWQFGRNVYVSEIYDLLDRLPGVDHVRPTMVKKKPQDELTVSKDQKDRLQYNDQGRLVAVRIEPDELVAAKLDTRDIEVTKEK